MSPADQARQTAEAVVRDSYGQLLALLCVKTRDIATAEDALSQALLAALQTWPVTGVPNQPVAWLLVAARRKLLDTQRADTRLRAVCEELAQTLASPESYVTKGESPQDRRLELMLACTHPAIDSGIHAALMLQVVLGLDAKTVAKAFLISPTTMSQRLVRAKHKLRDAGATFAGLDSARFRAGLPALLDALYAAFGTGWELQPGQDHRHCGLAEEALVLTQIAIRQLPEQTAAAELHGLLALMQYSHARRFARRSAEGAFVPLSEQDCQLWDDALLAQAAENLRYAASFQALGRFQLEAAIQAAHVERRWTGNTPWGAIAELYGHLVNLGPWIGARVAQAAAVAESGDTSRGLSLLQAIPPERVKSYQAYWATLGELLKRSGNTAASDQALLRAIGLTEDPSVRAFLRERMSGEERMNPAGDSKSVNVYETGELK